MRLNITIATIILSAAFAGIARAEQIDNPVYIAWAKCKPGTTATFRQISDTQPGQKMEMQLVYKLTAVKPDGVTLEVATKALLATGQWLDAGTQTKTIPVKIDKGREFLDLGLDAPVAISELKEGKEAIDIKGVKIDTTTRAFTATIVDARGRAVTAGRGQLSVKARLWLSADVPGGLVKSEQTSVQPGMDDRTSVITLLEFAVSK